MAKKRRRKPAPLSSRTEPVVLQIVEYEITYEPIQDRRYKRLPDSVKDAFERLHNAAREEPHEAIPELLKLIEKYPDMPVLYNYLSIAYSGAGHIAKARETIVKNYLRNPDYLFARLNFAELCLADGDYDKIAEIFEHKFDLKLLYPERKKFHISEVASFMAIIGIYFCEKGEREAAEKLLDLLGKIAPDYPMTVRLRTRLRPGLIGGLLRRMAGRLDAGVS